MSFSDFFCDTCGGPLDDTGHCPECEQNELQAWWAQQDQDEQWIEEQTEENQW